MPAAAPKRGQTFGERHSQFTEWGFGPSPKPEASCAILWVAAGPNDSSFRQNRALPGPIQNQTEQGEYRVYVWDANNNVGDYVLETGQVEVFGFPEIMQALFWVTHIIYDGEISNATCRKQLEALDERNPSVIKIVTDYEKRFRE